MGDPGREAHLGSVLRYAVAAASFGAGLIHFTAIFDHFGHPLVVAFFLLLAVAQVGWAGVVARRPSVRLLKAGAALSAGIVGIWLVSRTTGLPGVPGAEHAEPFGLKDGMASALEVLLLAGVASQFTARAQGLRLASGRLASGLAVSVIGVLTAAGLSAPGHGRHHNEASHDHSAGSLAAAGDHPHDDAAHGHDSDTGGTADDHHAAGADHTPGTHDHHAGSAGQHDSGHPHEAGPAHKHADGHDHPSSSLALAADAAEHDHNAPGHVHDPAHHHHHGHHSEPGLGHGGQPAGEPGHEHSAAPGSGDGHAHGGDRPGGDHHGDGADHHNGDSGHHHDGGGHDDHGGCASPLPENRTVTMVQEAAEFFLGVGCIGATATNTFNPIRNLQLSDTLLRTTELFIL